MPQTIVAAPATPEAPRKRWTRDECRRLVNLEVLEAGRFELIDGDIIYKMGQNEPHVCTCNRVLFCMAAAFGQHYVRMAAPVAASEISEPEPDIAVTVLTQGQYLIRGTPKARDLRLAIKVSDSTLQFDLTTKAHLYARARVSEYWVLDTNGRQLHVFHDPTADGHTSHESESVAPLGAPGVPVLVGSLLP